MNSVRCVSVQLEELHRVGSDRRTVERVSTSMCIRRAPFVRVRSSDTVARSLLDRRCRPLPFGANEIVSLRAFHIAYPLRGFCSLAVPEQSSVGRARCFAPLAPLDFASLSGTDEVEEISILSLAAFCTSPRSRGAQR